MWQEWREINRVSNEQSVSSRIAYLKPNPFPDVIAIVIEGQLSIVAMNDTLRSAL